VRSDVVAAVKAAQSPSEEAIAGAAALEAWDATTAAPSRGGILFQRFWELYSAAVRSPFAVPWDEGKPFTTPSGISDRTAAVRHLAAAVKDVRSQYGSESVAWGDVNRFRAGSLDLPGDGASGAYGAYRVVTFEAQEGSRTRAAGHLPGRDVPAGFGDAWILLVDFSRPGTAWSLLAYGQTTNPSSPHSGDQMQLFAEHKLRPVWFSEADIKAHSERVYRP